MSDDSSAAGTAAPLPPGHTADTRIDAKGRCCGRKPLHYKSGHSTTLRRPFLFCCRCDRAYDPETRAQIANWAWRKNDAGQWVAQFPSVAAKAGG